MNFSRMLSRNSGRRDEELELDHPHFGMIKFRQQDVIYFPQGIPGYDKDKHYVFLSEKGDPDSVRMISIDDANLSFILKNPHKIVPNYQPNISNRDLRDLKIDNPQSLLLYVILTLNPRLVDSTINLRAPILINKRQNLGKQLVLLDDKYSTKHPIFNPANAETK